MSLRAACHLGLALLPAFSPTDHCKSWTSNDALSPVRLGYNALMLEQGPNFETWKNERYWTSALGQACDLFNRLYCFEDG